MQAILYGTRTKLAPKETVERRGDDSVNGHIQQTEQDLNSTFTMRPTVKILRHFDKEKTLEYEIEPFSIQ